MKVAVIGSRRFRDYEAMKKALSGRDITLIVSGGAAGADKLAEDYAREFGIPMKVHYPDWRKYGNMAGIIRNKDIVDDAELVIAFWDGRSGGTQHSLNYARLKNKPVEIFPFSY